MEIQNQKFHLPVWWLELSMPLQPVQAGANVHCVHGAPPPFGGPLSAEHAELLYLYLLHLWRGVWQQRGVDQLVFAV